MRGLLDEGSASPAPRSDPSRFSFAEKQSMPSHCIAPASKCSPLGSDHIRGASHVSVEGLDR